MSTDEAESREGRGSPAPGCIILAAIVVIFGGLIVLYTVVGLYQTKAIDTFTQDAPAEIAVPQPTEAEQKAAHGKLAAIEKAVEEKRSERILFTANDLNTLIATLDDAKDFRGKAIVESIDSRGILARMAQPMRKGIFQKGHRYLNATFLLQPELRRRTIAFKVLDIRSEVGSVPEGFVTNYSVIDFFRIDPKNEAIAANIFGIVAVYTEDKNLVVETGIRPEEEE